MNVVTYGFFGEDEGQGRFLEQYLGKLEQTHSVLCEAHSWYSKRFKGVNNRGVDRGFRAAWLAGFAQAEYRLDCLFVGRDLDADTPTIRAERLAHFTGEIADISREDWKARTIFILPMQCIEHWLLALQRHADGRPSNACRDLEAIVNDAVKRELYDEHPRLPSEQTKDDLVTALSAGLDITWLAEVSVSFRLFHHDVEAYLTSLPAE
ncbi:hypothetical protein GCM10027422_30930 [Hymenobacter arcticus]